MFIKPPDFSLQLGRTNSPSTTKFHKTSASSWLTPLSLNAALVVASWVLADGLRLGSEERVWTLRFGIRHRIFLRQLPLKIDSFFTGAVWEDANLMLGTRRTAGPLPNWPNPCCRLSRHANALTDDLPVWYAAAYQLPFPVAHYRARRRSCVEPSCSAVESRPYIV